MKLQTRPDFKAYKERDTRFPALCWTGLYLSGHRWQWRQPPKPVSIISQHPNICKALWRIKTPIQCSMSVHVKECSQWEERKLRPDITHWPYNIGQSICSISHFDIMSTKRHSPPAYAGRLHQKGTIIATTMRSNVIITHKYIMSTLSIKTSPRAISRGPHKPEVKHRRKRQMTTKLLWHPTGANRL